MQRRSSIVATLKIGESRNDGQSAPCGPTRGEMYGRTEGGVTERYFCDLEATTSGNYTLLSTIIFLISAIALAGLSPFGQVCAQFMMVWQR